MRLARAIPALLAAAALLMAPSVALGASALSADTTNASAAQYARPPIPATESGEPGLPRTGQPGLPRTESGQPPLPRTGSSTIPPLLIGLALLAGGFMLRHVMRSQDSV